MDMLSAITRAETILGSMTFSEYEQHTSAPLATERLLQIITEASIQLADLPTLKLAIEQTLRDHFPEALDAGSLG